MTFEIFLIGLFIVATLTGLTTEALKKWLQGAKMKYSANTLAGYVALVLSAAVGTGYMVLTETAFNMKMLVYLIVLLFLSWLAAMVGYDKVIQTVLQIKSRM